jgi:ribosome maturation protein SDO1
MTNVIARIKLNGKNFEILVDVDKAIAFKKGDKISVGEFLEVDSIFYDSKKGEHASESDLQKAFQTSDVEEIAKHIVMKGEVQVPVEYKNKETEGKVKQVIDFIVRNAVNPQDDRPYTFERIETAMKEARVNVANKPVEIQIKDIMEKLSLVIPIKIESKKLRLVIPAQYSGHAYGLVNSYKESEEWMNNGDLKIIVNVPIGLQMEFYDKLNAVTHGAVLSEEVKE